MQTSTVQLVVKKLHAFHVPFQLRLLDNHAFNLVVSLTLKAQADVAFNLKPSI